MHKNMHLVMRWCTFGYARPMADGQRSQSSWLIHGSDDGDLAHLAETIASNDWAVFSGEDSDPEAPPVVALRLSESSDGRKICTGLLVGLNEAYAVMDGDHQRGGYFASPAEVTSRALRAIPVAELIGRAVMDHKAPAQHSAVRDLVLGRLPDSGGVRRSPGPKGHPDEHFRMVAEMYRQALQAAPRRPVVWMTEQLNADRTTVARWIQRARDKGFLDQAQPGKAGERKDDD